MAYTQISAKYWEAGTASEIPSSGLTVDAVIKVLDSGKVFHTLNATTLHDVTEDWHGWPAYSQSGGSNYDLDYNALTNKPTLGTAAATAASAYATAAQGATADSASQPGHTHTGTYEPANANLQAHVAAAHAPAGAQANADITKAEIEAKLTGEIASHTHAGGGADPWTYRRLTSDFTMSSTTAADITAGGVLLGFAPAANTNYEFEATLLLRTATATVNPRLGLAWPTGMTDGVAQIAESQSVAGAPIFAAGNPNASAVVGVGGIPNTTQSWPAKIWGTVLAGASPSGNVRAQMTSETAGTVVTVKAGSWFKYRTLP